MLILLLVLVGVALVTLAALAQQVLFAWIALSAAGLGLLLLVVRWRQERRSSTGSKHRTEPAQSDLATQSDEVGSPGELSAEPNGDAAAAPEEGAAPGTEPPDVSESAAVPGCAGNDSAAGLVCVIPGRRRYHALSCRLLDSHPTETVTRDEAAEEGFSACTVCGAEGAMPTEAQ